MFRIREVQTFIDTRTADFLTRRLENKKEEAEDWDRICKELAVEVCIAVYAAGLLDPDKDWIRIH
jgi:hypothetical protein